MQFLLNFNRTLLFKMSAESFGFENHGLLGYALCTQNISSNETFNNQKYKTIAADLRGQAAFSSAGTFSRLSQSLLQFRYLL